MRLGIIFVWLTFARLGVGYFGWSHDCLLIYGWLWSNRRFNYHIMHSSQADFYAIVTPNEVSITRAYVSLCVHHQTRTCYTTTLTRWWWMKKRTAENNNGGVLTGCEEERRAWTWSRGIIGLTTTLRRAIRHASQALRLEMGERREADCETRNALIDTQHRFSRVMRFVPHVTVFIAVRKRFFLCRLLLQCVRASV